MPLFREGKGIFQMRFESIQKLKLARRFSDMSALYREGIIM
jgi:hypothetical protein